VPWSAITFTPNTLAGYGIATPLGVAVGGSGADLAATGPGVAVQASVGAPLTMVAPGTTGDVLTSAGGVWASAPLPPGPSTPYGLAIGGSGADLSATGPGVVVQGTLGAALSVLPPSADGDVLTGLTGAWISAPPPPASLAIGSVITGGTAGRLLFEGPTVLLDDDSRLLFNTGTGQATFNCQINFGGTSSISSGGDLTVQSLNSTFGAYNISSAGAGVLDSVTVPGTSGHTWTTTSGAAAPSSSAVLGLPLLVYGSGAITAVLATPDAWELRNVGGVDYRSPLYL